MEMDLRLRPSLLLSSLSLSLCLYRMSGYPLVCCDVAHACSNRQATPVTTTPQPQQTAAGPQPTTHSVLPPGRPPSPPLPFPSATQSATDQPAPGFDATLPAQLTDTTSLIDVDLDALPNQPWTQPGAHLPDYFNYGFDPTTWKLYVARQKHSREDEGAKDRANPFRAFAELPPTEAWQSLSPEGKGQLMQAIVGNAPGPMAGMMMMGMPGMPGMPPMPPMGMPAHHMPDVDGPRGTKRLRGEEAAESADESSFAGAPEMMGMPTPEQQQQQQMMLAMQQSNMDPSQMDPSQMVPPNANFNARGGSTRGRGRGGRGNNPFGIGINPSARGRPVSPSQSDSAINSPLPTNVPTGPKGKPPSGPRSSAGGSTSSRLHRDKDRDSSRGAGAGGELDYGDGGRRERGSRGSRRYDEDDGDDYGRRRRGSRSPRRGRSRSPVYDDYE